MSQPLTREQQIADAIKLVAGILGERPASRVHVEVTRGGTYKVIAETGEAAPTRHQFSTGRGKDARAL